MPEPSDAPLTPDLAALEREHTAVRDVEQRHISFNLRPSAETADALVVAIERWKLAAVLAAEVASDDAEADFARRLRTTRESQGVTQAALAARAGARLSGSSIYKIEAGGRRATVGEARSLARALGVSLDVLAGGDGGLVEHREGE